MKRGWGGGGTEWRKRRAQYATRRARLIITLLARHARIVSRKGRALSLHLPGCSPKVAGVCTVVSDRSGARERDTEKTATFFSGRFLPWLSALRACRRKHVRRKEATSSQKREIMSLPWGALRDSSITNEPPTTTRLTVSTCR